MTTSDTDNQVTTTQPAISFYGKMLTFSRLQLHTDDPAAIEAHLAGLVSNKNSNIPVVIDSSVEQNLSALVDLLWSWGLQPIGVVTGLLDEQARIQRLAIFPSDGKRIERILPTKNPKLRSVKQLSLKPQKYNQKTANKTPVHRRLSTLQMQLLRRY